MTTYTLRVVIETSFDSEVKSLPAAYDEVRDLVGDMPAEALTGGCIGMRFRAFDITDTANHIEIL